MMCTLFDFNGGSSRQDFSWFHAVGGTDNSFCFHALNHAGSPVVTNFEVTLHQRDRGLSKFRYELDSLIVLFIELLVTFLSFR